ncbi:MAG: ABC transporter ATP-binding protein [Burkholderiales bacterium]|jgi:molybdate transport system ATP-binding protein|nr:ABC transporter ATP-binding protein [Burkholderiales bacterium]
MASAGLHVRLQQAHPIPLAAAFEVAAGELLALVGPSGSGKTTILRAIAGLVHPARGEVACGGEQWLDTARAVRLAPQARQVGMVFQHYALFPHLTAAGNVEAALLDRPPAVRRERARELLATVHLDGLADRLPRQLSGGQQQRVALARALAREPRVLLLDEPFSAVDQVTRRRLQRELGMLRQRLAIPIVLVTHDLEEAGVLADRMVVLSRGETLQDGPPFEVMAKPKSVHVARLVDFQNLLRGEVLAHDPSGDRTLLRWLDYTLDAPLTRAVSPGTRVAWGILPAHCILHRRDRPSRGERENPIAGVIGEYLPFGENAAVTMWVQGRQDAELRLSVPTHVADRNRLAKGVEIRVSLLKEAIHFMPDAPERLTAPESAR